MWNLLGLGTFFTGVVQHFNGERSRQHASDIEEKRQKVSQDIARLNRESAEQIARDNRVHDWRKHEELKALQRELVDLNCKAILDAAEIQRQATLELPEAQGIMAEWPLTLYPPQILQSHRAAGLVPLRLVPSFLGYRDVELQQLQLDLVNFMETHYPKESRLRPVEVLDGTWKPDKPHGGGSIKALFGRLHSEPMLIVRSTCTGNELTCRVAYWGIAAHDSLDKILINHQSYREILLNSAKRRVQNWTDEQRRYVEAKLASSEAEADRDYGDKNLVWNRDMLAEEEKVKAAGLKPKNQKAYKIDEEDEEFVRQVLMTCHKLLAAWFADAHYLIHQNVPPLLPSLLPELTKDVAHLSIIQEAIGNLIEGYRGIFEALQRDRAFLVPDLALELTQGLVTYFPKKAKSMYDYSINCWLNLRGKEEIDWKNLESMFDCIEDEDYVQGLKRYFKSIGDTNKSAKIDSLLHNWREKRLNREITRDKDGPTLYGLFY